VRFKVSNRNSFSRAISFNPVWHCQIDQIVRTWKPDVVIAREVKPPTDVEPVEWIILTNEKTAGKAAIETVLNWYECRWVVEEYHKAQKTGCDIEGPPFETVAALQPMVAEIFQISHFNLVFQVFPTVREALGAVSADAAAAFDAAVIDRS
jgi:hypothetical protein